MISATQTQTTYSNRAFRANFLLPVSLTIGLYVAFEIEDVGYLIALWP